MTKLSRLSPEQKTIAKTFTPRPYQNLIINHLLDIKRSNVWAGMGMGKTAATLTALENLYLSGSETKPTLVLAPLRV
ncbi:MAG: ATP-dependent helicase, partial [Arsenophonus sp.]|nr:ATP-dependent helicase [Arsenophonus sp.]